MDSRKVVFRETAIIALGVAVCLGIMYAVYAALGYFSIKVLAGGIVGSLLAILNFFFMAMNVSLAADKAANQDVKGGKSLIRFSYTARLAVILVVLIVFVKCGVTEPLSSVLPLVFVRPVITVAEFFRKK